ncbi:hyphal wall protein 2-like [Anoplophora glabripennis]|uniref:hyphal wall protein 2-like n=1 Tax=Anoplophora glabripennis TaxID=217634 RepID=UPI000874CE0D|nr:hyphal wall protein 2-like [Anoplophora glabripennis]
MVYWILNLIFVITLHSCVASKYYYKEKNGNYDVYYGPYAQWGYKEFRPPKSYKVGYDDRGDRPGKCIRGEFNCDSPYPTAETRFFECEVDYQCPRFFKCCQNRCFQHRICQPIDLKTTDDNNEIPTDEPVTQTTPNIVTTQSIHSTRRTTPKPTEGDTKKISEKPIEHTLRPTTDVKDEDIKQSTPSIATTSSPTTIDIIIMPTKETVTLTSTAGEDHSSPSTVRHTTTSKATQPSTSHSTKFTTTKRSETTTVTYLPSVVSTASPSTLEQKVTTNIPEEISTQRILEPTTTVKNQDIPSTPKVPIEFSTTDKDHLTTTIYTTTSKVTQPSSTAHSTTEITTKYLPSDVTHAEGNRTPKETSAEHTLNTPIKLEKESSQSTSAISTESSTAAGRITDVKEITTSTALVTADYLFSSIFPYSKTSTTTEPTTSISTKSSTMKGTTITTVSYLSSSPSTLQQEKSTAPKEISTQHMLKPTTTEKTEDTQSTSTVSTQFSTSTREITSTTTVTPTQSTSSYAVTSKATQPTLTYNTTTERSETTAVAHLTSDVFSTQVVTHEPEVSSTTTNTQPTRQNTEKASTISSTKSGLTLSTTEYATTTKSTSEIPELSTAKGNTTVMSKTSENPVLTTQFAKTTELASEKPELNTTKSKTTVIKASESPALTTQLSESSASGNGYPTTSVSSKTQLSTSTTKYETTEPTTESVTIKSSRILTPGTTAVFETSLNSITSSSPRDMTKPKTKLTSQTTESSATSPISITYKIDSTTTAKTPSSPPEYITTKSTTNIMSNSQSTSTKYSDSTQVTEIISTNNPFDYTNISSSTLRKSTSRMIDITSDDEDLIFSGDFEPSTINNELLSKSSVINDAKTTTKILDSFKDTSKQTAPLKETLPDSSMTKPESTYELTSKAALDIKSSTVQPFDKVTLSASDVISNTIPTTLITSKQTTGTKSVEPTTTDTDVTYKSTSKSVTDMKSGPITDDEDLTFSGDGDLQSDNLIQKRSTTGISSVITETNVTDDDFTFSKEVPRSSLKSISGYEELENKEFHDVTIKESTHYISDSTQSIVKSNTDKISTTESSVKLTTIASSAHTMSTTDFETNQIINENEDISFTKEPHSKENIFKSLKETEGTKNMATTIQYSTPYSSAVFLINSTPVYTNTEEANTQKDVSSKETFTSHDGYFSTTLKFTSTFPKNTVEETQKLTSKSTDAESSDLTTSINTFSATTSPESGYSYGNKIYMMEKLLDTSRKLPYVHEKAGIGDNYNFNNFLRLLDKISDLLGTKGDTIHNNLDFQISSPSTEKSTSYNTDQETMQSTTEGKHIMQVVEVEN